MSIFALEEDDHRRVEEVDQKLENELPPRESYPLELDDNAEQLRREDRVFAGGIDGINDELQRRHVALHAYATGVEEARKVFNRYAQSLQPAARCFVISHLGMGRLP